jgi:hypothetical protein
MAKVKIDAHCMSCGHHPLLADDDQCGGDYYEGELFECPSCGFSLSTTAIEVSSSKLDEGL